MLVCFDILFHGVQGHGVLSVYVWLRALMLGCFRELDRFLVFYRDIPGEELYSGIG